MVRMRDSRPLAERRPWREGVRPAATEIRERFQMVLRLKITLAFVATALASVIVAFVLASLVAAKLIAVVLALAIAGAGAAAFGYAFGGPSPRGSVTSTA